MIKEPTLFVLGAGASNPYGFPLGSELRNEICQLSDGLTEAAIAVTKIGFTSNDITRFSTAFRRSSIYSIDAFLSRHEQFVDIGKALIAAIICAREDDAKIFSLTNEDHWYSVLWNKLTEGVGPDGTELQQNRVRFITFNYDRSLEFFLHESTKATFNVNDQVALDYRAGLDVMHVYGSVGATTFANSRRSEPTRPYRPPIKPSELNAATKPIKIMPEGREQAMEFLTAQDWFAWAHHIYVLGFGFDPLNCARLGFSSMMERIRRSGGTHHTPHVYASTLGLTDKEQNHAWTRLLSARTAWTTHNKNNSMTLRLAGLPD